MTNNKYEFENEILEVEIGPDGEFDEETAKFIIEKCKEAADENIWYTQEEANRLLFKMIEESKKCIESNVHNKQI